MSTNDTRNARPSARPNRAAATFTHRPMIDPALPKAQGLYDPTREHDACGVGFVADMKNRASNDIVGMGLQILKNLDHRGAVGADQHAGDGCGMLVQIPHGFFKAEAEQLGFALPALGQYGVGFFFMPPNSEGRRIVEEIVAESCRREGQVLLGWRDVPTDPALLGESVRPHAPACVQVFVGRGEGTAEGDVFERRLFILRKVISGVVHNLDDTRVSGFYPVSLSSRTIVYKGLLLATRLGEFYADLKNPAFTSALALVHQRFSTNTFPSWSLAHPYRMVAHNGEINTLRGNVNWMAARQASVESPLFGEDIYKLWPISYEGQSDTACFDNALEFLTEGGYSLAHAMMMLIPEAWAGNPLMDEDRRAFYEYHASMMEPWDGPAAVAFTDGRQIGATLDRNGLRPARYLVTEDDLVVMASEAGVLPIPESKIVTKWRLQPGKMLLVDLEQGRIISDDEMKAQISGSHPYREWVKRTQIVLEELQPVEARAARTDVPLLEQAAGLWLLEGGPDNAARADGRERRGGDGLHGHRHAHRAALGQAEAAVQLLQAELRPGHESADRSDPRGARDEPRVLHRAAAEHLRPRRQFQAQAPGGAAADPDQRRSGKDPLHFVLRGRLRHQDARHHLFGQARARPRAWRTVCSASASAPRRRSMAATTSSSCRIA